MREVDSQGCVCDVSSVLFGVAQLVWRTGVALALARVRIVYGMGVQIEIQRPQADRRENRRPLEFRYNSWRFYFKKNGSFESGTVKVCGDRR